jgi:hypothetical protein
MPAISDANTAVDGRTQTSYSGDTNAAVAEVTTGPEVIIDYRGVVSGPGFNVTANDVVIEAFGVGSVMATGGSTGRGISLGPSGTIIRSVSVWNNGYDGVRGDSVSGFQLLDSVSRANGQANASNDGIQITTSSNNGTIRNNQFIGNRGYGIDINFGSNNMLVESNLVKGNGIGGTSQNAGIGFERAPAGGNSTVRLNKIIQWFGVGIHECVDHREFNLRQWRHRHRPRRRYLDQWRRLHGQRCERH